MNQSPEEISTASNAYHEPVMLRECLDGLNIRPDGVYVDVTYGGGGHSRGILNSLSDYGRLYAFDRDGDAVANRIDDTRLTIINENFQHLKNYLRLYGVRKIDGLIADLGISSHQIDDASRGFSTRQEGPLDLRMDRRQGTTAAQLVNLADENELSRILHLYGELPNARQMAHAIVVARATEPIETTTQLCKAVERMLPRNRENKTLAMLFQALRIEINGELDALQQMLQQATEILTPGGRLCVMSYHSLEDRLVKNYFRAGNFEGEIEKDFYGVPQVPLKQVTRKPVTASDTELARNNRARSAKLRVAERVEN